MSGAGAAEFPLTAKTDFCDSRTRPPLRSPLRDFPLQLQPIFSHPFTAPLPLTRFLARSGRLSATRVLCDTRAHHGDEIPERDVTYNLTCLLIYHGTTTVYRHFGPRTLRTQDTSDLPNFGPRTLRHVRSVPTLRHWCRSVFWTLRHYTCGVG